VNVDPVTLRWAQALFNLAQSKGVLADVERDIARLGEELRSAAVQSYLFGGDVSATEKRTKLEGVTQSFHEFTRNFVSLLFDKRREEVLRHVADAFRALILREQNTVEGHVETVRPLGAEQLDALATALGKEMSKTVRLEERTNPDLVGGMRIFVGAKMIDYSVQGRLDGLRRRMLEARLPVA